MLYETLKQGVIFLSILYFGILGGILYELKQFISAPFLKSKIISILLDIVFCVALCFLFLFSVHFTNYGEIRLFILISFFLGFLIERISIGTMLAKFFSFLYNKLAGVIKKIKLPIVSKSKKEKINETVHAKTTS